MPFPPSANFVQSKFVKVHDLDNASAANTQENNTISFFKEEVCLECKQLDFMLP